MNLWVLGSGSSGNAILLETARSRILVDAGFSPRVLKQRLAVADVAPDSIEAVVVTHEHTDHIAGLPRRRMQEQSALDDMVLYLCSDSSRQVTGSVFTLDDGQVL